MSFSHARTRWWTAISKDLNSVWFKVVVIVCRLFAEERLRLAACPTYLQYDRTILDHHGH